MNRTQEEWTGTSGGTATDRPGHHDEAGGAGRGQAGGAGRGQAGAAGRGQAGAAGRGQAGGAGRRPVAAIRPARPADQAALGDFFAGLSPRTRYLRFFAPVRPGPDTLRLLCGGARDTEAVLAMRGGVIIGHALAADLGGPPGARKTDIGVVVADAWQGRGIGSALVRALVSGARARGVTSVTMDVLPGNRQVLAMIASHWPGARLEYSPDGVTIRIRLPRGQSRPDSEISPVLRSS